MPIRIKTAETYDNTRKADYRRKVACAMIGNRNARALRGLMLTGPDGKEIPVWRGYGVSTSNMILLDCDSKSLANAQAKNRAGRAKAYNLTIEAAIPKLENDGIRLDMANLDYDGFLTAARLSEIHAFFSSAILTRGTRVCVTYVKGHDQLAKDIADSYCGGNRNELIRRLAENASGRDCEIVESDQYGGGKTGNVTMAWTVIELS